MKCVHCGRFIIAAPLQSNGSAWRHQTDGMRYCNGRDDSPLATPANPTPKPEQDVPA